MSRSYTQDFIKDDGTPVTVEYEVGGSYSPTTYSPHSGADGGDAPEIHIVNVWLNTPEHDAACLELLQLEESTSLDEGHKQRIAELRHEIEKDEQRVALTDAEEERMLDWLYEHYVEDDDDPEYF